MTNRAYAKELMDLHVKLVKLKPWVAHTVTKVWVVFGERDGAGKRRTKVGPNNPDCSIDPT